MSNESNTPQLGKAVGASEALDSASKNLAGTTPATPSDDFVMPEISGLEAKALAEESKATGKSIQELLMAKAGKSPVANQSQEPTADQKEQAREAIRKYKVKVGGHEREVDEKELLRGYSHQQHASKILQEGQTARKQAEQFISMMKDPEQFYEVAKKLGHDPRGLAEKYLVSQLEDELLDPREKELKEARFKLKAIEDKERKQKESIEAQRLDEVKQKYVKDFETKFIDALQKSDLPPTKPMIAEMAKYISRSAKIGFKMEPHEAAQLVKEDIQKAQISLIGNADGETLLKLLGDDVAKKILTARGSKVKQTGFTTPAEQAPKREIQPAGKGTKRMSPREWRDYNRKKN